MRVAIVIVSYNGAAWLPGCLNSCSLHAASASVYVVDNASTDHTADIVRKNYPQVTLIALTENKGFAGGNNVGIARAQADGAEAILLLNQDAELTSGALDALVAKLVSEPKVAAVQPIILLPNGSVNSAGNAFHYLGFGYAAGYKLGLAEAQVAVPWLKNGGEPPYVSGAALLMRVSAIEQCGALDNDLFMYHEDLEWCLRVRLAGWKLAVESQARVVHHYEFSRSTKKYYYMERNRFVVWLALFTWPTLLFIIPLWLFAEIPLLAVALVAGWGSEKLRAYAYLARPKTWSMISMKSHTYHTLRKVSDRELLSFAVSRIDFQEAPGGAMTSVFNVVSSLVWRLVYPCIRW